MKRTQKGFTIIEVALVLAVGAMIFLVVFLAVPALQRNQRNDAHKRDISSVATAVVSYTSNNPTNPLKDATDKDAVYKDGKGVADQQLGKYIDTLSVNTEHVFVKENYSGALDNLDSGLYQIDDVPANSITVLKGYRCASTTSLEKAPSRSYAVVGGVETANGSDPYCVSAN